MSNSDRGAYTPPTEPPLQFDARQPVRGRGPAPMMLIVSVLVLLVLLGAIFIFYRSGQQQTSGPPPMVGTPVGQIKSPAPVGEQPTDPAQGLQIYRQAEGQETPTAPNFTPPPEQPKVRMGIQPMASASDIMTQRPPAAVVQAPSPVAAMPLNSPAPALKPTVSTASPAPPAPIKFAPAPVTVAPKIVMAPLPTKPAPLPSAKPQPLPPKPVAVTMKAPPVKPPIAKVVVAPPAAPKIAPTPSAPSGGASVQIGAFSSQALADQQWSAAVKLAPGKGKRVEAVPKGSATLYRTTVTGFGSRADATAFCDKLKAASKSCFVK